MRSYFYFLIVLVTGAMLFSQSGCQRQTAIPEGTKNDAIKDGTKITQGEPEIIFHKLIHDFGSIGPQTNHMCTFEFTNIGEGLLKIEKITRTCGCTPYTLDKSKYLPGENGILEGNC